MPSTKCIYDKELVSLNLVTKQCFCLYMWAILLDLHWLPIQQRILFKILILTYQAYHKQWRSEGGAGGGHLPPGAARRGAPKSCQGFKKNYIRRNF